MARRSLKLLASGLLVLLAGLALALASAPAATAQEEEEPLDSSVCAGCHEDQVAAFAGNPHALLNDPAWGKHGIEDGSCVSCHAGAAAHVEEGGGAGTIFAFGAETPAAERIQACQECHADTHPRFLGSEHAQAGAGRSLVGVVAGGAVEDPLLEPVALVPLELGDDVAVALGAELRGGSQLDGGIGRGRRPGSQEL
ncbi:MAG TPA: hypothetical protein VJG13_03415, partial [Thermoanaerobaculia bacterium]|nr:hypothetical protein [Thermoanaerobaculia bacterium]